jgi:hypothetical protein
MLHTGTNTIQIEGSKRYAKHFLKNICVYGKQPEKRLCAHQSLLETFGACHAILDKIYLDHSLKVNYFTARKFSGKKYIFLH